MGKRTKAEAMETRKKILNSALDVFFEKNYADVKVVEIAQRIGLTKGAVYWHFKNKEDILFTLTTETIAGLETTISSLFAVSDSVDSLRAYYRDVLDKIKNDDQSNKVHKLMFKKREWPKELQEKICKIVSESLKKERMALLTVIKKAQENGKIESKLNPETLSLLLINIFHGFSVLQIIDLLEGDFHAQLDLIFDALDSEIKN
ncbi:MAG: TetR family transcriptional regulator [Synergistaceae bacterium]